MKLTAMTAAALSFLVGCNCVAASPLVVQRACPGELLRRRAGPGLRFKVILGLPDGTSMIRRDCVTELGQEWCRVFLSNAPDGTGYMAEDYLSSR